jgi:hypothetical protein
MNPENSERRPLIGIVAAARIALHDFLDRGACRYQYVARWDHFEERLQTRHGSMLSPIRTSPHGDLHRKNPTSCPQGDTS